MTIWKPGMHAVCISNNFMDTNWDPTTGGLSVGTVYRVTSCQRFGGPYGNRDLYLGLAEFPGTGHDANLFRPALETRLDQFKAHLVTPPREKVDA